MTRAARLLLAVLVALAAVVLAPTGASAAERTVTYTVSSRGSVAGDLGHFAAVARQTLGDYRGWSLGGSLAFQEVGSGSSFDLILASPQVIAAASPGCSSQWSCRVGRSVYINDDRWRLATESWPHGLDLYRQYVILHEVGHWLGLGHTDCPTPGRTAWVMQQQSISLQGCRANVWPVVAERQQVANNHGVSVNWSGIDREYLRAGQEGGVYGYPVTWEKATGVGYGMHQVFRGGEILWTPETGVHGVWGGIGERYHATGGVQGPLRYPTTDELPTFDGVGRFNHFSGSGGGSIYWSPRTGAHEVYGGIHDRWAELRYEQGPLGYPTTGEGPTAGGRGRYNHFSGSGGGSIYWSPGTGAHEVYGAIHDRWRELNYEQGPLGYPTTGEYSVPGGRQNDFEHGYIRWDAATGQTEVVMNG